MEVPTQTSDLQAQLLHWKGEVEEVRNNLRSMRSRLEEIVPLQMNQERMAGIEHFQNQFIRQLEVADEMFHDLKQSAKSMSNSNPVVIHQDRPIEDFNTMQDRMEVFHKLHNELKGEFYHFESFK